MNNFVQPNVNKKLGKELTLDEVVKGVAFFKKTGQKDPCHNKDILEPLTEEELEMLKSSEDPKKTLKDSEWERVLCIEAIDPEFKSTFCKGHIRILFFEKRRVEDNSRVDVYLDGEPQMNLAVKYAFLDLALRGHLSL